MLRTAQFNMATIMPFKISNKTKIQTKSQNGHHVFEEFKRRIKKNTFLGYDTIIITIYVCSGKIGKIIELFHLFAKLKQIKMCAYPIQCF